MLELNAAWEVYVAHLHLADDPYLRTTVDSFQPSAAFYRKIVAAGIDGPAWPKGMMAGLRQGSRETFPDVAGVFRSHPEVVAAIRQAGGESLKQLLDYPDRVAKMIARGRIRNEDEYYAARARLDDIEGDEEHGTEQRALHALLDRFDLGA